MKLYLRKIDYEEGQRVIGSGLYRFACFDISDAEISGVTTRFRNLARTQFMKLHEEFLAC